MGKKKTAAAVLALVFSLFSFSAAYAAEGEEETQPEYTKYVQVPEDAEALAGEYIPVLMYHHFAIRDMGTGNGVVTTTEELEDHLKYFKSQGWRVVSLEELDKILTKAEKKKAQNHDDSMGLGLDIKYLCITMDDGYFSNYELGYPLFKEYRSPASVFAVTDYVTDQIGIKKFTWKQAAEMEKSGYMKVYSHTADHQPVEEGKELEFLASAQRSEEVLEEQLRADKVKAIAYPNGRYTEESQQLLTEDGYVLQFTVDNGVITAKTERDEIPRIMISSGMDGKDVVRKIELAAERAFAAEGR